MKAKTSYMVDFRCPRCNCVLIGRADDEVRILKTKPKAMLPCKHCKIECKLASGTDDLGLSFWYTQPTKSEATIVADQIRAGKVTATQAILNILNK